MLDFLRRKPWLLVGLMAVFLVATAEDCSGDKPSQRAKAVAERKQVFAKAESVAPTPHPTNFPLRRALVAFTERQDQINHPWYVYMLADTGNTIGYYVAKTVPINACDFLSSTEDVYKDRDGGNLKITAPSLDGIFYGGSGASGGCDSWFWFDYSSNALVQIRGVNWYASDKPLAVDAEAIKVAH